MSIGGGNEQSSVGGQPDPGAPQPASLPELSEWPSFTVMTVGPGNSGSRLALVLFRPSWVSVGRVMSCVWGSDC